MSGEEELNEIKLRRPTAETQPDLKAWLIEEERVKQEELERFSGTLPSIESDARVSALLQKIRTQTARVDVARGSLAQVREQYAVLARQEVASPGLGSAYFSGRYEELRQARITADEELKAAESELLRIRAEGREELAPIVAERSQQLAAMPYMPVDKIRAKDTAHGKPAWISGRRVPAVVNGLTEIPLSRVVSITRYASWAGSGVKTRRTPPTGSTDTRNQVMAPEYVQDLAISMLTGEFDPDDHGDSEVKLTAYADHDGQPVYVVQLGSNRVAASKLLGRHSIRANIGLGTRLERL